MDGPALTNVDRGDIADESLWREVRRVTRPIIVDIAVFVLILLALLLGFLGLHALKLAGYDGARVHTFEVLHYWCYSGVYTLFGVDLLFKITLALFFRNSIKNGARPR
jgi:hypothetical protein